MLAEKAGLVSNKGNLTAPTVSGYSTRVLIGPGLTEQPEMKKLLKLGLACAALFSCPKLTQAQDIPHIWDLTPTAALPVPSLFSPAAAMQPVMIKPVAKPAAPCARQYEPFDVDDYNGPLNQLVARFSQRVDSATVRLPRHPSALRPCSLNTAEKFRMFVNDNTDPLNFVGASWDAAVSQLTHDDRSYGQGSSGYGKRYSADLADNLTSDFFGMFLYPSLFRQDPRYFRMGEGSARARLGHALAHRFVTQSDSGKPMFNYSEWMGVASAKALTNLYHPDNRRGFGPTASRVGASVANDMAWDVLREFWPEVAHKFHLPFRTHEPIALKAPVPLRDPVKQATPGYPAQAGQPELQAAR